MSASSKNNNSRPAFGRNDSDGEIDRFGGDNMEHIKKSEKSKGQKTFKSWKSTKSGKNSSKSGNSPNFGVIKSGPSFLTPGARKAFNCLQLIFTKALIIWHLDLEYYIWIKSHVSGHAIGSVLSKLAFGIRPDEVVTKTDLGQWHPVAFFSRKMIPAETWYETYNGKLWL